MRRGRVHRRHARGAMNRTEAAYAVHLEAMRQSGEIDAWDFEPVRLRLSHASLEGGQSAWYTPDFRVVATDGTIEMHEVKGRWEEAARVRIRVAADRHPYLFVAVYRDGSSWRTESIE